MQITLTLTDEDGADQPWRATMVVTTEDGRAADGETTGTSARQALESLLAEPEITSHDVLGPGTRQLAQPFDGTDPLLAALADALQDLADVSEENEDQQEAQALREAAEKLLDPRYTERAWDHAVGPFLDQLPEKI